MKAGYEPKRWTPWGRADYCKEIAEGIYVVGTPSHGGVYVAPELYKRMPEYMKTTAYSQGGFFEEDCDWCLPFVVFEGEILAGKDEHAIKTIKTGNHWTRFEDGYHKERFGKWVKDRQEREKVSLH